jgi:hypothetical protein
MDDVLPCFGVAGWALGCIAYHALCVVFILDFGGRHFHLKRKPNSEIQLFHGMVSDERFCFFADKVS